ncbi:glutamine amidotransferase [Ktedonosporobacter rubrisoli]|uniref:Glutamine amidotransferase n=1 Tax=Ktedonosporobacter rubrisoli TaxID=2509675 RepID=A0A4P6JYI5_KTERU|nr:DJ-1/PfpI family protein [Ktedonosporobacter rubrisoli]QBD80764.1 glutamine amidotransferase [Ktedonosporobacter rubrisoli]
MELRIVHLFLAEAFSDIESSFVLQALNAPPVPTLKKRYQVKTVAESSAPVTTAGGITILPDITLAELAPAQSAMLILPGSPVWPYGKHAAAVEKARAFLEQDVPVAAICEATVALAKAGLLNGRQHTSNIPEYLLVENYEGYELYQYQPVVTDGNLITASGLAPLDFAYHILTKLQAYPPRVLGAWYSMYETMNAEYFFDLHRAAEAES